MDSTSHKALFMTQINNSFGSGALSLALNEVQFSQFVQYLKNSSSSLPIKSAANIVGKQEDYPVWVMGEDIQLNQSGDMICEEDRQIVWHQASLAEYISNINLCELVPHIHTPLDSSILTR